MSPALNIQPTLRINASDEASRAASLDKLPHITPRAAVYALKRALIEAWFENGLDRAATLTYFSVLTIAPAFLAVYSIATLILAGYTEELTRLTENFIGRYIPDEYADTVRGVVDTIIGSTTGGVVALAIGAGVALVSSSGYTRAFSRVANQTYRISEGRPFLRYQALMLGVTLVTLVGTVLMVLAVALNATLVRDVLEPLSGTLGIEPFTAFMVDHFLPVWNWLRWPVLVGLPVLLVRFLYHHAPNIEQRRFRWISTGAVTAVAGLWVVAQGLRLYLFHFAATSPYGAMGAIVAVVMALWLANAVILFGFKLDAELERARQLLAGLHAEVYIQLPPRAIGGVETEQRIHDKLRAEARTLRRACDAADDDAEEEDAAKPGA